MWHNRTFQIAFLVSLLAHGTILLQNSHLGSFRQDKKEQKLEVRYIKEPLLKEQLFRKTSQQEPFLKLPSQMPLSQRVSPPRIDKDEALGRSKQAGNELPDIARPVLAKPDIIAIKKRISIPALGVEKINNPTYLNYYQIIREKIKRQAYRNYTRIETGEVYLSFIVSSDGALQEIRLIEEKSSQSTYLKQTAILSVKDAAPFPVFPKTLDYPRLSFNAVISFEVE
jgi:TonB family protein